MATYDVTLGATEVAFALAFSCVLITYFIRCAVDVATTCWNRHRDINISVTIVSMWFLEDELLTLDVEDGIDVSPGGYRQLANFVELVPGVELGDAANFAEGRGLVYRIGRLKNNNIIEFHWLIQQVASVSPCWQWRGYSPSCTEQVWHRTWKRKRKLS